MSVPLVVIIPTKGAFDYAAAAVDSALLHSPPDTVVVLVDDASGDWNKGRKRHLQPLLERYGNQLVLHHFAKPDGLTRSWNHGLTAAKELDAIYTVCTNSDVLFTPAWFWPLEWSLTHGAALAGPVSNAPGVTSWAEQYVGHYLEDYALSDDATRLAQVAADLRARYLYVEVAPSPALNGFCLAARTSVWWENAYDDFHVFNPQRKMTRNEDELQGRWFKRGLRSVVVPASFVFHYRAVSRGPRHKHRGWFRRSSTKESL